MTFQKKSALAPGAGSDRLSDKNWRMSRLYKIKDKKSALVSYCRNSAQTHFQKNAVKRNIVLKSRQLGITTEEAIDTLDEVLFTKNLDALFIAHTKEEALKIFDNKIDLAWKNIPEELKQLWTVDAERANTLKFLFPSGGSSSISVSTSGRSGTYHRVHITEFAKMCKLAPDAAKEIISGTIPSVPMTGRIDIESTAEGETDYFHDMFWEAWNREGDIRPTEFKAHFYNWQWDVDEISTIKEVDKNLPKEFTDYQSKHNEMALKKFGIVQPIDDLQLTYYFYKWLSLNKSWPMLFEQYPTTPEEAFITSGSKFFDQASLADLSSRTKDGEVWGDWTFYEEYNTRHHYAMGVDVAEGVGGDSSACVVWDFDKNRARVVATYRSNAISPDLFAYEIKSGAKRFGMPLIAVERNNHGHATLGKLKEIYPIEFIYKEVKTDKENDEETERLGWHTTLLTKPRMLYDFRTSLLDGILDIPSKELLSEMRTYSKDEVGKTKNGTKHWDLMMAAAIGFQMKEASLERQFAGTVTHYTTKEDLYSGI